MRRIVIPSVIEIEAIQWSVYHCRVEELPLKLRKEVQREMIASGAIGYCSRAHHAIVIRHDIEGVEAEVTLLHEVLHAILTDDESELLGNKLEEHVVEFLDAPLLRVLKQLERIDQ